MQISNENFVWWAKKTWFEHPWRCEDSKNFNLSQSIITSAGFWSAKIFIYALTFHHQQHRVYLGDDLHRDHMIFLEHKLRNWKPFLGGFDRDFLDLSLIFTIAKREQKRSRGLDETRLASTIAISAPKTCEILWDGKRVREMNRRHFLLPR